MRGHTLVWHSQTPKWLFEGEDGKQVNKEILLQRIHDHIDSVVGRYKGKIYAWDVALSVIVLVVILSIFAYFSPLGIAG